MHLWIRKNWVLVQAPHLSIGECSPQNGKVDVIYLDGRFDMRQCSVSVRLVPVF